jgi:hypothetical protein
MSSHNGDSLFDMLMDYVTHQYQGLPESFADIPPNEAQEVENGYYTAIAAHDGGSSSTGETGSVQSDGCAGGCLAVGGLLILAIIVLVVFTAYSGG